MLLMLFKDINDTISVINNEISKITNKALLLKGQFVIHGQNFDKHNTLTKCQERAFFPINFPH